MAVIQPNHPCSLFPRHNAEAVDSHGSVCSEEASDYNLEEI